MDKIASHLTQKRQELSLEQTIWQNTEPSSQRTVGETLSEQDFKKRGM